MTNEKKYNCANFPAQKKAILPIHKLTGLSQESVLTVHQTLFPIFIIISNLNKNQN
ncbi:MAG: hypothetical protein WC593_05330 [Methanoregula sp.]